MVFVLIRATRGIGVKRLKAAINSKYADKSVLVMDSDEVGKALRLMQIKSDVINGPEGFDAIYMVEPDMARDLFRQKSSENRNFVYIDYGHYMVPLELVDACLVMGLRFNEEEFRKCYLDYAMDAADVDVSAMKSVLSRISLEDVNSVILWGDAYGYKQLESYSMYKSLYMYGMSSSIIEGYKAMDANETIEYTLALLSGTQHGPKAHGRSKGSFDAEEKLVHTSPLLDSKWHTEQQEARRHRVARWRKMERKQNPGRRGSRRRHRRVPKKRSSGSSRHDKKNKKNRRHHHRGSSRTNKKKRQSRHRHNSGRHDKKNKTKKSRSHRHRKQRGSNRKRRGSNRKRRH